MEKIYVCVSLLTYKREKRPGEAKEKVAIALGCERLADCCSTGTHIALGRRVLYGQGDTGAHRADRCVRPWDSRDRGVAWHCAWSCCLWAMLSGINFCHTPSEEKCENKGLRQQQRNNNNKLFSPPSVVSLSFFCFSLTLMLADTAG